MPTNPAYVRPGVNSFDTKLAPDDEIAFQMWVRKYKIPFNPSGKDEDYDMRGWWKAHNDPNDPEHEFAVDTETNANDNLPHFTDHWKKPNHASFSRDSKYANPDTAPEWNESDQLVEPGGKVLVDEPAANAYKLFPQPSYNDVYGKAADFVNKSAGTREEYFRKLDANRAFKYSGREGTIPYPEVEEGYKPPAPSAGAAIQSLPPIDDQDAKLQKFLDENADIPTTVPLAPSPRLTSDTPPDKRDMVHEAPVAPTPDPIMGAVGSVLSGIYAPVDYTGRVIRGEVDPAEEPGKAAEIAALNVFGPGVIQIASRGLATIAKGGRTVLKTAVESLPHTPAEIHLADAFAQPTWWEDGVAKMTGEVQLGSFLSMQQIRNALLNTTAAVNRAAGAVGNVAGRVAGTVNQGVRDFFDTSSPVIRAGRTIADQAAARGDEFMPQLNLANKLNAITDQFAPITRLARMGNSEDVAQTIEAGLASRTGVSGEFAVQNAITHGELDHVGGTIPLVVLRRMHGELAVPQQRAFNEYIAAENVNYLRTTRTRSLRDDLQTARAEWRAASAAGNRQAARDARTRMRDIQTRITAMRTDQFEGRLAVEDWDRARIQQIRQTARQDPAVMALVQQYRRLTNDMNDYMLRSGVIDHTLWAEQRQHAPLYMPFLQDPYGGASGISRSIAIIGDRAGASVGQDMNRVERVIAGAGEDKVNIALAPLEAMELHIRQNIRLATMNEARRMTVDELRQGEMWNRGLRYAQQPDGSPAIFSRGQLRSQYGETARRMYRDPKYTRVWRDGRVELYEFADDEARRAMIFERAHNVPILNQSRKIWQFMTTGAGNPMFAIAKALPWDVGLGAVTRQPGRSFGYIDTGVRRIFHESNVANAIMDRVTDPTAYISSLVQIPTQMYWKSSRYLAEKIANDLATTSGVFQRLAGIPGVEPLLRNGATAALRAFEQSNYAVLMRNRFGHANHLTDAITVRAKFDKILRGVGGDIIHDATSPFRLLKDAYMGTLDSIHNAAKMSFFSQNYGRLYTIHGGNVPADAMERLVHETRKLTGDMSRVGVSQAYNRFTSIVPYSNAIVQGGRHIFGSLARDMAPTAEGIRGAVTPLASLVGFGNNHTAFRILSGVVAPSVAMQAIISNWKDDNGKSNAAKWWFDDRPAWDRMSTIPIVGPQVMIDFMQGKHRNFSPDDISLVQMAPELIPLAQFIIAGARGMGIIGNHDSKLPYNILSEIGAGIATMGSVSMPPLLNAAVRLGGQNLQFDSLLQGGGITRNERDMTAGGIKEEDHGYNSNMPEVVYDIIGNLFGTGGKIAADTYDAFANMSRDKADIDKMHRQGVGLDQHGMTFDQQLNQALRMGVEEFVHRGPRINIPGLFHRDEKLYAFTPESEYVYKQNKFIGPLIAQYSNEFKTERKGVPTYEGPSRPNITEQRNEGRMPPPNIVEPRIPGVNDKEPMGITNMLIRMIHDRTRVKSDPKTGKANPYRAATLAYGGLGKDLAAWNSIKYKTKPDIWLKEYNRIIKAMQANKHVQMEELVKLESDMRNEYGVKFGNLRAATGQKPAPLTYESVAETAHFFAMPLQKQTQPDWGRRYPNVGAKPTPDPFAEEDDDGSP